MGQVAVRDKSVTGRDELTEAASVGADPDRKRSSGGGRGRGGGGRGRGGAGRSRVGGGVGKVS